MEQPQILLTNDDGIRSPGLWMAAQHLSQLGYVNVAAPRDQLSGAGRSLPSSSDGMITTQPMEVNGQTWQVYAVGASPAQVVLHAVLEILPHKPDLVVSGINYGENVGTGITVSGTVGAAMEAASMGIPSLAISLETCPEYHLSYSTDVDFSVAGYFAVYFGKLLLKHCLPFDVDVLKVDVPSDATPDTPWMITRVSRTPYYEPLPPERDSWEKPAPIPYRRTDQTLDEPIDSDVYALRVKRLVSVTPLSLDLTSRVDMKDLDRLLRSNV